MFSEKLQTYPAMKTTQPSPAYPQQENVNDEVKNL